MKRACLALCFLGALLLVTGAGAEDIEMGITTGSEEGTYYQFGQDMSRLVASHGIKLNVLPSRGSFENMVAVYDSRRVQLGMAQSDVVLFMNLFGEPQVRDIANEIKVVFPLYNEEIHLLAPKALGKLSDLTGKRVAIGRAGSGTAMTATVVLGVAGVNPSKTVETDGKEAIDALRKDELDAMFFVAGFPVKLFKEEVSATDKLHLLPIDDPKVVELYGTPATIPTGTYPWQDSEVDTINITAGLMTLDYSSDNINCVHVKQFAKVVRENLDWLKANGHEKWTEVDLAAPVTQSLHSKCAS